MIAIQSLEEKERALDILERAFYKSPGIVWMIGNNNTSKRLRRFLNMFLMEASLNDGACLTSDKNGVVLFFQLQKRKTSLLLFLNKLYVLIFLTGIKRGLMAMKYKKQIDEIRPKTGWFGWLVATDDKAIGKAAGYEIKQWMFKRSEETKEPIYVETTVPRVMTLYKAAGYIEYAKIKHPYEDIHIWFLKREPKTINI